MIERQAALGYVLALLGERAARLEHLLALVTEQQRLLDRLLPEARRFLGLGPTEAFRLAGVGAPEAWRRVVQLGKAIEDALDGLGPNEGVGPRWGEARLRRTQRLLGLGKP